MRLGCGARCQLAMTFWHVIFGEDLALPKRLDDKRLPMFLRAIVAPKDFLTSQQNYFSRFLNPTTYVETERIHASVTGR